MCLTVKYDTCHKTSTERPFGVRLVLEIPPRVLNPCYLTLEAQRPQTSSQAIPVDVFQFLSCVVPLLFTFSVRCKNYTYSDWFSPYKVPFFGCDI